MSDFEISWIWRSREPAKCAPDENYPYGKAIDLSDPENLSCGFDLPYPAPGVGTWIVKCKACGHTTGVTAAGRPDDPTTVKWACERRGDH